MANDEMENRPDDCPAELEDRNRKDPDFPRILVEAQAVEQQSPSLMHPVAGFGASAGGLQVFRDVLENLNPQTGISFVLVTHLAPDQKTSCRRSSSVAPKCLFTRWKRGSARYPTASVILRFCCTKSSHRLHRAILQDLGLAAALKAMVQQFAERENMPATYNSQDLPESWSPQAAAAIYRIAQEALRNVSKHAGKTHLKVVLAGVEGRLQLRVMHFDQEADGPIHGLGMISMSERARLVGGTLDVTSRLGQGTTVTATVPLEHHA